MVLADMPCFLWKENLTRTWGIALSVGPSYETACFLYKKGLLVSGNTSEG